MNAAEIAAARSHGNARQEGLDWIGTCPVCGKPELGRFAGFSLYYAPKDLPAFALAHLKTRGGVH